MWGAWRLWESFNGKIKEVTDHNYNSGMIRLSDKGYITYNIQIHSIEIGGESLLARAVSERKSPPFLAPTVNSVHWLAVDDKSGPCFSGNIQSKGVEEALYNLLVVSARAKPHPSKEIKNRKSKIMVPEEDTVEAFESKHGAPLLGIQWHPEGYFDYLEDKCRCKDPQQVRLLQYMAKAGDAYAAKQRLLKELKATWKL